ncbi:MAG TPA: amidohydrolase family protein [Acidimicrobiales bacterium]|jgi:predicted TIM-barrel fold metal-dependent hydrolase
MSTSSLGMISADSHVNEPRDLWSANLPASMRERAMKGIEATEDGGWSLILDGSHIGKAGSSEADRLAVLDPAHRLAVMREEGIAGECIFPTIGLYVWMLQDSDDGRVSCRIYNDWIHDQLERQSPRFRCAGVVPTWRIEDAIEEVGHIAALGLGAAMLPTVAEPSYNNRRWEPLWDAIEAARMPVVMHQGTGHDMIWYRGPGATVANLLATQSVGPRTAALLATSGVLERHPDMHVVFVEYNVGWLPWMMETVDFYTESFDRYGTTDNMGSARLAGANRPPKPVITPQLEERPSFYVRRQVHATFQDDQVGMQNINITGVDALLWGSDYPHEEGTYPNSRATVDRLGGQLKPEEAEKIFRDTAARLFHFDPEVLAAPA